MTYPSPSDLHPEFASKLEADMFQIVGWFEITPSHDFNVHIHDANADDWEFCIYSFLSIVDGGKHLRIGKSQGKLSSRLRSYCRDVSYGIRRSIPRNECFSGGTTPWEANGWLAYNLPHGRGLMAVRHLESQSTYEANTLALGRLERVLQAKYDPPLCNDTSAGRQLKRAWIIQHGAPKRLRGKHENIA